MKGVFAMRIKTILYGILILVFIFCGTILALAASQNGSGQTAQDDPAQNAPSQNDPAQNMPAPAVGDAYLYTGSPLILSNGEVKMLDPTNPDLGATVVQSRTLLPLRAISEYFGAEVSYDKAQKIAMIKYDGKQYLFPIGSRKYTVDDGSQKKEFAMDSQSMLLDGRTMVPLRVICENVLGKKVSYYDRVIAVTDKETDLAADKALIADVKAKIGEAVKAGSMKELEQVLTEGGRGVYYAEDEASVSSMKNQADGAGVSGTAPAATEASPAAGTQAASTDSSYSATNVQVEGIDEADIVKTDGKYIYIAGNNVVRIVGANKGKLSDATAIRLSTDKNVTEIYVDEDRLILLGNRSEFDYSVKSPVNPEIDMARPGIMPPYKPPKTYSFVDVYNISDRLKPTLLKSHEMEGYYQSSRKNGDIVYLVTNTYASGIVLPMMRDTTVSSDTVSMKLDDVMIMPAHPSSGYLVVSAINVKNQEKTEVEAITAYGSTMYMNDSSLYLAFNNYTGDTSIIRFDLEGMKVGYAGSGEVPGYLLNQFSMDEYKGNLRVATTVWGQDGNSNSNSLYVLDPSLNIIGSVKDLAKGESIYSVRFIGDNGYVVTYRNMDPLFVFDLSDPKKPVLTGELEIPGFSNYLHPVGDNLLLGIGADTYDIYRKDSSGKDIVIGTRQGGIKFSLFDISDKGKPKEISKYVVGDSGSGSEALYNHKAIMIDGSGENVAIDAYLNYENQEKSYQQGAIIMSYSGNKLTLKGVLDSEPTGVYGNDIPYARRILYIGDELYYVQDGRIDSYNYESLKKIDSLTLQ